MMRFNPLHCGAVVASFLRLARVLWEGLVSIPFIAGQWSLLGAAAEALVRLGDEFQSPSLRGSGRFGSAKTGASTCSSMFQSPSLRGSGRFVMSITQARTYATLFQSPSLRGSGRFRLRATRSGWSLWFQSPSLRGSGRFDLRADPGAVAAPGFQSPSLRGSGRFGQRRKRSNDGPKFQSPSLRGSGRFDPAVVARLSRILVSIPFIAGQWSLLVVSATLAVWRAGFNPLHCGAVVASMAWACDAPNTARFQSPSLRGSGRFNAVSTKSGLDDWFQSPSLRGSGRFVAFFKAVGELIRSFNPLHCGAVVASRSVRSRRVVKPKRFNPLHCGAVVASGFIFSRHAAYAVSIPFIAGQWSLR